MSYTSGILPEGAEDVVLARFLEDFFFVAFSEGSSAEVDSLAAQNSQDSWQKPPSFIHGSLHLPQIFSISHGNPLGGLSLQAVHIIRTNKHC